MTMLADHRDATEVARTTTDAPQPMRGALPVSAGQSHQDLCDAARVLTRAADRAADVVFTDHADTDEARAAAFRAAARSYVIHAVTALTVARSALAQAEAQAVYDLAQWADLGGITAADVEAALATETARWAAQPVSGWTGKRVPPRRSTTTTTGLER